MKKSTFKWSYNSELNLRSDITMSRERLAKLVKSWRAHGLTVTLTTTQGKTLFRVQAGGLLAFSEVTK